MELETLVFLILIVGLSAFVQGLTGFGIGIPMMLFLPYVFGYQTSVAITVICAIVMSGMILLKTWEKVEIKKILPVVIPVVVMEMISTHFLFVLNDQVLTIVIAVMLLLFAGLFFLSQRRWQIKASAPNSILAGSVTGLCNMLGMSGPPLGYYYHSIFEDNIRYLANLQATLVITLAVLLVQHIIKGNITPVTLGYSAIASAVCVIVLFPALKVFKKLDRSKLTTIIIAFLILMPIIKLVGFYWLGGGQSCFLT